MSSLVGKVAILTAAASDTSQAIAATLAAQGVSLVLCAPREDFLQSLVETILAQNGRALAVVADLVRDGAAEVVVEKALQAYGRIDILILNAAVWGGGLIHEHSVKTWDLILGENLRSPFLLVRAALAAMRAQHSGEIIFLTSESALHTYERDGAYGVALHGLAALAAEVQLENQAEGIRVQTLYTTLVQSANAGGLQAQDIADWVQWLLHQPEGLISPTPILLIEKPR